MRHEYTGERAGDGIDSNDIDRIDLAEVTKDLASGARFLRFSGNIESVFEAETGAGRATYLALQGFPALFLFNGYLFLDYLALPDIFWFSVCLRLGGLTLASLLTMWLLTKNPSPFVREGLETILVVIGALTVMILVMNSNSPYRESYQDLGQSC